MAETLDELIDQSTQIAKLEQSLSVAQRQLVSTYVLHGFNAASAARELGRNVNATYISLQHPKVRRLIDFYLNIYALSTQQILHEFADVARNSSADGLVNDQGKLDLKQAKKNGSLKYVKKIEISARGDIKIEMLDRVAALSMLAKASGLHHKRDRGPDWRSALREAGVSGDAVITQVTQLIIKEFYPDSETGFTARDDGSVIYETNRSPDSRSLPAGTEDDPGS